MWLLNGILIAFLFTNVQCQVIFDYSQTSDDEITVSWTGDPQSTYILYRPVVDGFPYSEREGAELQSDNSFTLPLALLSAEPGATYSLSVQVDDGSQSWTEIWAQDVTIAPAAVSLSIVAVGMTEITVTWTPADGSTQDSYLLRYFDGTDPGSPTVEVTVVDTSYTLVGLQPGHFYLIEVYATSQGVNSLFSSVMRQVTEPACGYTLQQDPAGPGQNVAWPGDNRTVLVRLSQIPYLPVLFQQFTQIALEGRERVWIAYQNDTVEGYRRAINIAYFVWPENNNFVSGSASYRESTLQGDLVVASEYVCLYQIENQQATCDTCNFTAIWAFLHSFDELAMEEVAGTLTGQLILTTDGDVSYVIFVYEAVPSPHDFRRGWFNHYAYSMNYQGFWYYDDTLGTSMEMESDIGQAGVYVYALTSSSLDECERLMCYNGGTCFNEEFGYTCECAEGYTGGNCELAASTTHMTTSGTTKDVSTVVPVPTTVFETTTITTTVPTTMFETTTEDTTTEDTTTEDTTTEDTTTEDTTTEYTTTEDTTTEGTTTEDTTTEDTTTEYTTTEYTTTEDTTTEGTTTEDTTTEYTTTEYTTTEDTTTEYTTTEYTTTEDTTTEDTTTEYTTTEAYPVEEFIDCSLLPCLHGGSCLPDDVTGHECMCAPGFTGRDCESEINECEDNMCTNGATCIDEINTYICECVPGYTGNDCETEIDECETEPCLNGGTCEDGLNSYSCSCAPGTAGTNCDEDVDECIDQPCLYGECVNFPFSYECSCLDGYTDSQCETEINECEDNMCMNGATCIDEINTYICECVPGYTGNDCETEIDECETEPCLNGGTCEDGLNSYSCSCAPGATGTNCDEEINECEDHACMNGATCNDEINTYTCQCIPGYTGTYCENEINECEDHACMNGATCNDEINIYTCQCIPGYTGTYCENDIDECEEHLCENGASCSDGINMYTCDCLPGYTGGHCETDTTVDITTIPSMDGITTEASPVQDSGPALYPMGEHLADFFDGNPQRVDLDRLLLAFGQPIDKIYVYESGYVTLQTQYQTFTFSFLPSDANILAVYFAWQDASCAGSNVSYQVYSEDRAGDDEVLERISSSIANFTGQPFILMYQAVVVTWWNMLPFPCSMMQSSEEGITYQLVLASDSTNSYAFYIYPSRYPQDGHSLGSVRLGYSLASGQMQEPPVSGTASALTMLSEMTGEVTNIAGLWLYPLFDVMSSTTPAAQCSLWYETAADLPGQLLDTDLGWDICPCNLLQASLDWRFCADDSWANVEEDTSCYRSCSTWFWEFPENTLSQWSTHQVCCYSRITGSLHTTGFDLGSLTALNMAASLSDLEAKHMCCGEDQYQLCLYYQTKRPPNLCTGYTPATTALLWGDPHITSLDGLVYTYNGFGHYWMVKTPDLRFGLQSQMFQPLDVHGQPALGTSFSAFAATARNSALVHIFMDEQQASIIVSIDGEILHDFLQSTVLSKTVKNITIIRNEPNTEFIVALPDGYILNVNISRKVLAAIVTVPLSAMNQISGLVGLYNGDPADDFTLPDGSRIPIDSSDEIIYRQFGETWKVPEEESWFDSTQSRRRRRETYTSQFVTAWDSPEEENRVRMECEGNMQCVWDYYATGDGIFAMQTLHEENDYEEANQVLRNHIPYIDAPTSHNLTLGESVTISLFIRDEDPQDTLSLQFVGNIDTGDYSLDMIDGEENSYQFFWMPTDIQSKDIGFVAYDNGTGVSAQHDVVITICSDCSGHGQCDWARRNVAPNTTNFFTVECSCYMGYTGPHCELDVDGCLDDPCQEFSECTDEPADQQQVTGRAFSCSSCPTGFYQSAPGVGPCFDINECEDADLNDCDQVCFNTYGDYMCSCETGYYLSDSLCTDNNECDFPQNLCPQVCTNIDGSYGCSCFEGFEQNLDGSCFQDPNACPPELACSVGCVADDDGVMSCVCNNGYRLLDNGSCEEIDECREPDTMNFCSEICVDFDGGFECRCSDGFYMASPLDSCHACEEDRWGPNCRETCSCGPHVAACDPANGCVQCLPGWSGGYNCPDNINECLEGSAQCGENADCIDTLGSYSCFCHDGFIRDVTAGVCIDIDECETSPCSVFCENTEGGYSCSCEEGFVLNQEDFSTCNELILIPLVSGEELLPDEGIPVLMSLAFDLPWKSAYSYSNHGDTIALNHTLTEQVLSAAISGTSSVMSVTCSQFKEGSVVGDFVFELDYLPDDDMAQAVLDLSNRILSRDFDIDGATVSPTLADDVLVRVPGGEIIEVPVDTVVSSPCSLFDLLQICGGNFMCEVNEDGEPECVSHVVIISNDEEFPVEVVTVFAVGAAVILVLLIILAVVIERKRKSAPSPTRAPPGSIRRTPVMKTSERIEDRSGNVFLDRVYYEIKDKENQRPGSTHLRPGAHQFPIYNPGGSWRDLFQGTKSPYETTNDKVLQKDNVTPYATTTSIPLTSNRRIVDSKQQRAEYMAIL